MKTEKSKRNTPHTANRSHPQRYIFNATSARNPTNFFCLFSAQFSPRNPPALITRRLDENYFLSVKKTRKRRQEKHPAPLLVLFNKDGCLASKIPKNYNAKSEFRSKKTITDIDMPKDMLQIISWIINVPCHLVSSVVSRQLKNHGILPHPCCTPKKGFIIYIYNYIRIYNIV